jgi:hypothetical protein
LVGNSNEHNCFSSLVHNRTTRTKGEKKMKNIALYLVRNNENLERTKSTLLSLLANPRAPYTSFARQLAPKKKNKEEIRSYMGFS